MWASIAKYHERQAPTHEGGYRAGHKAEPWRTKFGDAAIADSRQTQAGQSGLRADTCLMQVGHMADKVWRRSQMSRLKADSRRTHDTRRTSSGDAARAYRGQPFSSKREPHSKLFGEKHPPNTSLCIIFSLRA